MFGSFKQVRKNCIPLLIYNANNYSNNFSESYVIHMCYFLAMNMKKPILQRHTFLLGYFIR